MVTKDYIEREALIRYAEKQEVIIKDGTSLADAMRIQGNVFRRSVETCPPADVEEVRHGEWVEDSLVDEAVICSLCGYADYRFDHQNDDWGSKFCPNCGAKMDGKAVSDND